MLAQRDSHKGLNIAETLSDLTYLIGLDADNPALVRSYVGEAECQLVELANLLRSMARESTPP
jgi:hypothetical protein